VPIAGIGTDMSVFISVYHRVAWAGLCPGSHESAGKRRNVSLRKGNMHLRTILVGTARTAVRTKAASRTRLRCRSRSADAFMPC
jgi:transposase